MLAINGGVRLWYIEGITNMRFGKYRRFSEVQALDMDPYNGDAYVFMSKDRRILKVIRYKNHKRVLYDITYEKRYKFMKPVMKNHEVVYELDFCAMKKQDQTVENMIMQAHYLEALEIESKAEKPLADMERQDFVNTITELKAMISSLKLTIDTLRQTINSQNATMASLQKSMDRLQSAYGKAVKERDDLNGRMNRSNQETFGSKSLKQSGRGKVVKNDRQKERDEWSSKDDNDNNTSSASLSADGEIDQTKVKSENLSRSGRNGMKYNRMTAAKTITLETSLEGAPEDMKFIGYKDIEEKSILNIDETWTKVRIKFKGDKTQLGRYFKKYVWVLVNKAKQITYFFYDNDENDSRGKRPIQTFLVDFLGTMYSADL